MRLLYSPRNDPQIDPEMIPISLHVDPKMIPVSSWNGMVFGHGIIIIIIIILSLLQRLRSWIAFNISLQFMWFFSALVI